MIRKTCDSCERTIEVEDDLAGQKVACEACGDINLMPETGNAEPGSASDRASAMGLPPDDGPEQHALKVRPAMLRARPFLFLAHLLYEPYALEPHSENLSAAVY